MTSKEFIQKKKTEFQKQLTNNKNVKMNDIGRNGQKFFIRDAWTLMQQSNAPEKVFVIERLKLSYTDGKIEHADSAKKGLTEYRIGYFIVGKNGNKKGKWTWGQYCPTIPIGDLTKLLKLAQKEGTIKL